MIRYLIVSLFICVTASADDFPSLINKIVPAYPVGSEVYEASCVSEALGKERVCDIAVDILKLKDGYPFLILAATSIKNNLTGTSQAQWLVTDQIQYPKVGKGESLVLVRCRINEVFDSTILAVVTNSDSQWLKATDWVRKVDLSTGKFLVINERNVECENIAWGL